MTRDAAPRIGGHKPALVESRFFPALKGESGKMSASDPTSAIYVTDTPKQIKDKVNKYAFSGGRETLEEHRALGGDLNVDIPWKWLNFFLDDDDELRAIGDAFASGAMSSGEIKAKLIACLSPMIATHQENRAKVTEATVDQFFSTAPRDFDAMFGALSGDIPAPPGEKEAVSFQGGEHLVARGAPERAAAAAAPAPAPTPTPAPATRLCRRTRSRRSRRRRRSPRKSEEGGGESRGEGGGAVTGHSVGHASRRSILTRTTYSF